MYVEEKSVQRKRTFVLKKREEKASRRTREKLLICLRMCVGSKQEKVSSFTVVTWSVTFSQVAWLIGC